MTHSKTNQEKCLNGKSLEDKFELLTGLKKMLNKEKPFFINSLGKKQIIDFDFKTTIDGVDIFIDLTTTFRSDRLKQKAYNAIMYKTKISTDCKFYMGVGNLVENGKTKNPILIEGIDNVILVDELVELVNKRTDA